MVSVSYGGNWIQTGYSVLAERSRVRCNYFSAQTMGCVFTDDNERRWLKEYTVNGRSMALQSIPSIPAIPIITGKYNEYRNITWYMEGKMYAIWKRPGNACNK